jgi:alpha-1,6-mannosyltransferase
MPMHWYFTTALPKALLAGLLLAPLGFVVERRVRWPFAVAVTCVALLSILGHKEVRLP